MQIDTGATAGGPGWVGGWVHAVNAPGVAAGAGRARTNTSAPALTDARDLLPQVIQDGAPHDDERRSWPLAGGSGGGGGGGGGGANRQ